jgi:hypothetical protein
MKKWKNFWRKGSGYISVETVIVARLMLGFGALSLSSFQTSSNGVTGKSLTQVSSIQNIQNLDYGNQIGSDVPGVEIYPNVPHQITFQPIIKGNTIEISGIVTDQYGNFVTNGTEVQLFNGSTLIGKAVTNNGKFSFTYTLQSDELLDISASSGNAVSSSIHIEAPSQNNQEESFSIDVNKDLAIHSDGTLDFKEGTWTYTGNRPKIITPEGELVIQNPGNFGLYSHALKMNIDTATLEAEVKVLKNNGYHGMNSCMSIRTGNTGFVLSIYPNKIELYDNVFSSPIVSLPINGAEYHTYRIVKENNKGTLYIDGQYINSFTLRNGTGYGQYSFFFGDGTSLEGKDSLAYFKNIRIAEGKALYLPQ